MKSFSFLMAAFLMVSLQARAGDISSSGDELPKPEFFLNYALQTKPLLYCTLKKIAMVVEISGTLNEAVAEGALRVTVPGETGGAKVLLLNKYRSLTQINPSTGEITMRYLGGADAPKSEQLVRLVVIAKPVGSKLEVAHSKLALNIAGREISAESDKGELSCAWGAKKTRWD